MEIRILKSYKSIKIVKILQNYILFSSDQEFYGPNKYYKIVSYFPEIRNFMALKALLGVKASDFIVF